MDHAEDVAAQRHGGCFRLQQHHGGSSQRQVSTNNASSPTSTHPARLDACPAVVVHRADCVATTKRSSIHGLFVGSLHRSNSFLRSLLARTISCDINTLFGIWRFKAFILIILLVASFADTASGRLLHDSPGVGVCYEETWVPSHGRVCYIEEPRVFTRAMSSADHAVPPTPAISGKLNLGCRYTEDLLAVLACFAPWYSIMKFQQIPGVNIQLFRWTTGHLKIWRYMAVSSIFYYMTVMLYGLSLADVSKRLNIAITNCICSSLFVILLVLLLIRHKTFYQVTCVGISAVGGGCFAVLALTIPFNHQIERLFRRNHAIQGNVLGIIAMALMITMPCTTMDGCEFFMVVSVLQFIRHSKWLLVVLQSRRS